MTAISPTTTGPRPLGPPLAGTPGRGDRVKPMLGRRRDNDGCDVAPVARHRVGYPRLGEEVAVERDEHARHDREQDGDATDPEPRAASSPRVRRLMLQGTPEKGSSTFTTPSRIL